MLPSLKKYNRRRQRQEIWRCRIKCIQPDYLWKGWYVGCTGTLRRAVLLHSETYWKKSNDAPSSLTYYVGINKKINNLLRHTLFFDPDLKDMPTRSTIIHSDHRRRNFMFSVRPKPTTTVAPVGHENIFILIPVVSELHDSENIR